MGNYFEKFVFGNVARKNVLFLGLNGAGKSTMLYKLYLLDPPTTPPFLGFTVETYTYHDMSLVTWDVGGRSNLRPLWRQYYKNVQGLVYVIDTCDRERLEEAGEELQRILGDEELLGIPVLVFANKSDLPNGLSLSDISIALQLEPPRKFLICRSSATSGEGIVDGMTWLSSTMNETQQI